MAFKKIKDTLAGAKETLDNYSYTRKANKKSKQNIKDLAISKAKKNYKKKTGKTMTPSALELDAKGIVSSKEVADYVKEREALKKKGLKKYDLD